VQVGRSAPSAMPASPHSPSRAVRYGIKVSDQELSRGFMATAH
jgi:hypothetical protein